MSVIYCTHILHNMHGYNHCVKEAEVLRSSIISELTTFIITSLLKCQICYIMKGPANKDQTVATEADCQLAYGKS